MKAHRRSRTVSFWVNAIATEQAAAENRGVDGYVEAEFGAPVAGKTCWRSIGKLQNCQTGWAANERR